MLDFRALAIALGIGVLVGAIPTWWLTAEYKDNKWMAQIEAQKVEAARQLQEATEKVVATERKHNAIATQLEIKNAEQQTTLDRALADNRRLASRLGGLRDPGSRASCPSAVSTASGTAQQPSAEASSGRLSAEATDFLLEFARDADRAAQYANSCHDWINKINE